jgi:hypothetical protein
MVKIPCATQYIALEVECEQGFIYPGLRLRQGLSTSDPPGIKRTKTSRAQFNLVEGFAVRVSPGRS